MKSFMFDGDVNNLIRNQVNVGVDLGGSHVAIGVVDYEIIKNAA